MNSKKHYLFLNYFKAFLVMGMITGHAVMLLSNSKNPIALYYKTYINLITFSGFFFAYGFTAENTIISPVLKLRKHFLAIIKLLIAFYISGIAYRMIIKPGILGLDNLLKILILKDIPGYSEFLIAFALIQLCFVTLSLIPQKIKTNNYLFIALMIISLLSSLMIKKGSPLSYTGLLIGSNQFGAFPVLQYSIWFFTGLLFRRGKIVLNPLLYIIAILFSSFFIVYYIRFNHFPNRFPPSFVWITGSAFPLFLWLKVSLTAETIHSKWVNPILHFLDSYGKNTLFSLLISNILLFILSVYIKTSPINAFMTGISVIALTAYLISIIRTR